MAFSDLFSRNRRPLDAAPTEPTEDGVSPVSDSLGVNDAVRHRQRMLLAGAAGIGLLASSVWIFGSEGTDEALQDAETAEVKVSTGDMVNRNMSEKEWMALSENRFRRVLPLLPS